jgi:ABC-type transport system involved in multi-copper enzyme maturation permease subunit
MPLLSENPVLLREVRSRLRWRRVSKQTLLRGGSVVAVLALLCYARLITLINRGRPDDAATLWWVISYGLLLLIVLLAPALAATAISQEREQQTWEGLVVTRLTPMQILAGKWTARQMLLGITLVILAPLMIAVAIKGQLPFVEALLTIVILVMTSGFYSAMGMFCSYVARRTAAATATALLISVFLCLGTLLVNEIFFQLMADRDYTQYTYYHQLTPILWLNPFLVMIDLQEIYNTSSYTNPSYMVDQWTFSRQMMLTAYPALTAIFTALMFTFMTARYRKPSRER